MTRGALLLLAAAASAGAEVNYSTWVWPGAGGRLQYRTTALGDRIPDFSLSGYRGGGVAIPDAVAAVAPERIVDLTPPESGDAGALIQSAIDGVSAFEPDAAGLRGVVRLAAGEYGIAGRIFIRAGGVVLRGAGESTVLRATGTGQRTLIVVDPGTGSLRKVAGTERRILDTYVPVGATSFRVEDAASFRAGDAVVIFRPSTAEWLHDLGMDRIPGAGTVQWTPGSKDLRYERVIVRVEGDRLFLDAPVCNSFEQRYGGGTVYKYEFPRIREVGIENLSGDSDYKSPTDEDHAWTFLSFDRVEDGWARNITASHFGYAAVNIGEYARRITVQDSACLDPVSIVTGSRRYSFNIDGAFSLVRDVRTRSGRHDFVQGSLTYGPNVFLHSRAERALDESGPHHRWSTGTLFDGIVVEGKALAAWNRGEMGTGHGWSGANMVFWNSEASPFRVQSPYTAQNWVIGGIGKIETPKEFLGGPLGIYDAHGAHVALRETGSLYLEQLRDRIEGGQFREYALGDYDGFTDDGAGNDTPVDAGWRAEVERYAAGALLARFDERSAGAFVPFTFQYRLDAGERIIAATLTVALDNAAGNALWLARMDDAHKVTLWDDRIFVFSLTGELLDLLQQGKLDVAAGPGVAVDWARLDLVVR